MPLGWRTLGCRGPLRAHPLRLLLWMRLLLLPFRSMLLLLTVRALALESVSMLLVRRAYADCRLRRRCCRVGC